MRAREILLFTLLLVVAFVSRGAMVSGARYTAPAAVLPAEDAYGNEWAYDPQAPYYGYLPSDVQSFRSSSPNEAADTVCKALGGRVDFLQRASPTRVTLGFNCRFHEPDLTISAEFGDLRRMPVRRE